jgi:hypothetical protein
MHPLLEVLAAAAADVHPPVDGGVDVYPLDANGTGAVVELTGHSYVLTDRDPDEVVARGADGFGGASAPDLKLWLAGPGGWIGTQDAVLVARGRGGGGLPERTDLEDHSRVVRARQHRGDLRVFGDEHGLVTIGHGLVGRTEISVELFADVRHGTGHGRRLIGEGLDLVEPGALVFAQVAPGNAASVRAFLRAGFSPLGAETLFEPQRD